MDPRKVVTDGGYSWEFAFSSDGPGKYGVSGIPHTVFIDRSGNIKARHSGGMGEADFEAKLKQIL